MTQKFPQIKKPGNNHRIIFKNFAKSPEQQLCQSLFFNEFVGLSQQIY